MALNVSETTKPSALVGRGGVQPVAVDTSRRNQITTNESPPPQAIKALANHKPDARGLVAKINIVA